MRLSADRHIYDFCARHAPVLRVASGQTLEVETKDCFCNQMLEPGATLKELDWGRINPATGPIYVEGAEPGDSLRVEIQAIELAPLGVVACLQHEGVLGHLLAGSYLRQVPVHGGYAHFDETLKIPLKPMIGVIGVAPAGTESIPTGTPGRHGGNMDNTLVAAGASLYFPVEAPGALLALGDCHAVMGDGEIGVSGLEIPATVTLRVEVVKGRHLEYPLLENAESFATVVSKEDLEGAVLRATELMLEFLEARTAYSRPDLVMLMSLIGSVEICQVVDPLKTVRFVIPKQYFPGLCF